MPIALRYIAYALPQTFACEAMRGILLRGWYLITQPAVYEITQPFVCLQVGVLHICLYGEDLLLLLPGLLLLMPYSKNL